MFYTITIFIYLYDQGRKMSFHKTSNHSFQNSALRTISIETEAVSALVSRIDETFDSVCELILKTNGRIVLTGLGKSGHIASKIASTLASTGTPAFFVHPAEALHGDMGMITKSDCVIAISNSGVTKEILAMLPIIKRLGCPLISLTGNNSSTLAQNSNLHLNAGVDSEACPLALAPTSSTTAALVLGDALAIALLEAKNFSEEDFAMSHPGGLLGKRLILKVADMMHTGDKIPVVRSGTNLAEGLMEITQKGLGMTTVVDSSNILLGVFTDGDLRRALTNSPNFQTILIDSVMSENGISVTKSMLAAEATLIMKENKISSLVVTDSDKKVEGVLHLMELLRSGLA